MNKRLKIYNSCKRNNNAVTLIALVITIIILIILAGISIMGITQTGIFDKAKLAKNKYEKSQEEENETLNEYESKINEYGSTATTRENNNSNNYSTQEVIIGKWIDGKPIYRKTIIGDTLPAHGTVLINKVESVVNAYGEMLWNNRIWYHFPYTTIIRWELYEENHTLRACIADANYTTKYRWNFEYTKISE